MFSAVRLQYWHRWPSRAKTALRDRGTRLRYGTRTKWLSRITDGTGKTARSECRTPPLRATISAFSFSTSTTARRIGTTHNGSKLALSSRALPKRRDLRCRALAFPSVRSVSLPATSEGPRRVPHPGAPLEVRDEVGGFRPTVGAVLRLEPEPEGLRIGQRKERRAHPPSRPREPEHLTERGRPEPRPRHYEHRGSPPEAGPRQRGSGVVRHRCAR